MFVMITIHLYNEALWLTTLWPMGHMVFEVEVHNFIIIDAAGYGSLSRSGTTPGSLTNNSMIIPSHFICVLIVEEEHQLAVSSQELRSELDGNKVII